MEVYLKTSEDDFLKEAYFSFYFWQFPSATGLSFQQKQYFWKNIPLINIKAWNSF